MAYLWWRVEALVSQDSRSRAHDGLVHMMGPLTAQDREIGELMGVIKPFTGQ